MPFIRAWLEKHPDAASDIEWPDHRDPPRRELDEAPLDRNGAPGAVTELLEAREVPLGGVRGITVHRTLPQRALPMVGAWCFLDRFDHESAVMRVLPHPHIGCRRSRGRSTATSATATAWAATSSWRPASST